MSGSPLHAKQTIADGIHAAVSYVYPNAAARTSASGFTSEDLYKLALQTDDNSIWLVTGLAGSTPVWLATLSPAPLTLSGHSALRQLVHLAEGGPFEGFPDAVRDIEPAGSPFPTSVIWWTDETRQEKIIEKLITRNPNQTAATIQWKVYVSGSNTVAASVTDTITYQGIFEVSRTRSTP